MATAHLLARNFRPAEGLHHSSVDELWHVKDIESWSRDNTKSAVLDAVPGTIGAAHPDISAAILVTKVLHERISNTDAIVALHFRTNHGEVYRVRSTATHGYTGQCVVPVWTRSGTSEWRFSEQVVPREFQRRTETRYLRNGSLGDDTREDILNVVGTVVFFPDNLSGIPYLLKSPSIVDFAPGQSRLIYTFETCCRMIAQPAGTLTGQDIALPALNYLDEYFAPDGHAGGTPIPIQVRSWNHRYPRSFHFQIPFL